MDDPGSPTISQRLLIDRIADDFEAAFRGGHRPSIESIVANNPSLHVHLLRELIALEIDLKQFASEIPSVEQYLERFPDHVTLVEEIFLPITKMAKTSDRWIDSDVEVEPPLPDRLGRYILKRVLGKGGFGVVYLAHDPKLDRLVAIKVPIRERFKTAEQVENFIQEACTAAKLKHPGLVAVHDVQEFDGLPFIVQDYIDGGNLAAWVSKYPPTYEQITRILISITESVGYAHQQKLTHCDLKLVNVLMDQQGRPYVADFGLAVHESVRSLHKGARFGTRFMMAPEQVRGEGHRLDGRTDIWAIGVMLYELLVKQKPFAARSEEELFNEIETLDPRPPRQIDRQVPRELERICLKCLEKRRTERYNTTDDLREDLQAWLNSSVSFESPQSPTIVSRESSAASPVRDSSTQKRTTIIPKGLRSFDGEDADFFLDLIPGPRDRDGLPGSIRFWKNRIEENDSERTFSVGLIYGPSGCGKSSLVKAGLLPKLHESVLPIYVEATPADTELRILRQLRRQLPGISTDLSLADTFAEIRQAGTSRDCKPLIVIDQFEQWLHSHSELKRTQLIDALRQCDGRGLQAILLVRDDFFASVHRLFQELETPLIEGKNYALVDRFDMQHACKVLSAFGRAYGKFEETLSEVQEQFVIQAVEQLAENDKVICVRLSLFADMLKSRPWTASSLKEIGGVSGVGVTFLEETFSNKTALPSHRVHASAIRQVLAALLPAGGSDIRGGMQPEGTLRAAAGYQSDIAGFEEVMRILEELRIITPTESDGEERQKPDDSKEKCEWNGQTTDASKLASTTSRDQPAKLYQLTHDYLVPSLREWLTRKQRESPKGRAELKLAERASVWIVNRENKQLPTLLEWLNIRLLTSSREWSDVQRSMMLRAARFHGMTWGGLVSSVLIIGFAIQQWFAVQGEKNLHDRTLTAIDVLQNNSGPSIPFNLEKLATLPDRLVRPMLRERFDSATNPRSKLALAFGLAQYKQVEAGYLASRINDMGYMDNKNCLDALRVDSAAAVNAIKSTAATCRDKSQWRHKVQLASVACILGDVRLVEDVCQIEDRVDPEQRTLFIDEFRYWEGDLRLAREAVTLNKSPALRSGICLAVGQIRPERILDTEKEAWLAVAKKWYTDQPDSSTHSAAAWLLREWGAALPPVIDQTRIVVDKDWFVNSVGATMLRIHPGFLKPTKSTGEVSPTEVIKEFWAADREVSVGQFVSFMQDPNYATTEKPVDWKGVDQEVSPTPEHPVHGVSWNDAVMYCNWLSKREYRTPCYERMNTDPMGREYDSWRLIPRATGYRLLWESEWEYCCRAIAQTEFSFGDDESFLSAYCQAYPTKQTAVCGKKLPNSWGLHDALGNVFEWCTDASGSKRMLRGGCWEFNAKSCRPSHRDSGDPTFRAKVFGFRLAIGQ